MRVVVTGGGTGGHIYPALSVAERLTGAEVDYIGAADGPEARIVPAAGFRFHGVPSRKMARRLAPAAVLALATAGVGVARAVGLLRQLRPDAVLGTGGYASAPVVLAAAFLRIPVLLHEGNAIPGRTNRWLARLAGRVAISFEEARPYFAPGKTVLTGFPVRRGITAGSVERARRSFGLDLRPLLFAFGGSGGAASINRAVCGSLPLLADLGIQVVHQTGRSGGTPAGGLPEWYHPVTYVEAMADALAAADLVVCRCGASTLAEVTAVGRPGILVPYPFAHADHQTHNARALVKAGAATLIPDRELTGQRLAREVRDLFEDPERRGRMAAASRGLACPEAAERVATELARLAGARLEDDALRAAS